MADALEWTVDHRSSRTVRVLAWTQVAIVDVGVVFAALALGAAVAGVVVAAGVAYAVAVVLVAVRAIAWLRGDGWLEAAWRSRNDWLGEGSTDDALVDAAASPLPAPSLAPAIVVGSVVYVTLFATVGAGALVLLAVALIASALLSDLVGEGASTGRLEPAAGRLTVDGRSRPLATIDSCSRVRLGDLELLGCRGPAEIDDLRWLAVPAARADDIVAALDAGSSQSIADRPGVDEPNAASWRRLQAPRFALSVVALLAVAGVGGTTVRFVGEPATTGLVVLAAAGFVVICVASATVVTAVLDR